MLSYPSPERGGSDAKRRGWGIATSEQTPTRLAALATLPFQGRDKKNAIQFSNSQDSNRHAIAPVFFAAPGTPSSDFVSLDKVEGMERRSAQHRGSAPCGACASGEIRAPLGAPSRRFFATPGRAFRPRSKDPGVSELLAGGLSASGRSPGAARVRGCEPRPRAPHPAPPSRRLMRAPSMSGTDIILVIIGLLSRACFPLVPAKAGTQGGI